MFVFHFFMQLQVIIRMETLKRVNNLVVETER